MLVRNTVGIECAHTHTHIQYLPQSFDTWFRELVGIFIIEKLRYQIPHNLHPGTLEIVVNPHLIYLLHFSKHSINSDIRIFVCQFLFAC